MHIYLAHEINRAIAASVTKTLVQVVAPATRRLEVIEFGISFDGVTAADPAFNVDLLRQTDAGTMTAFTPRLYDPADPAALASAQVNATAEPTAGDILSPHELTPNGGLLVITFSERARPIVAAGGRIGIRVSSPAGITTCNATGYIKWQE